MLWGRGCRGALTTTSTEEHSTLPLHGLYGRNSKSNTSVTFGHPKVVAAPLRVARRGLSTPLACIAYFLSIRRSTESHGGWQATSVIKSNAACSCSDFVLRKVSSAGSAEKLRSFDPP
jgi:hypothetical protein